MKASAPYIVRSDKSNSFLIIIIIIIVNRDRDDTIFYIPFNNTFLTSLMQ